MPINHKIPGQLRDKEMQAIEIMAGFVPENGLIVEVGSLWGLSSWIWAKSADPSVSVHCFDPWPAGGPGTRRLEAQYGMPLSLDQFRENTKDCANIFAHQGFSPDDFRDWEQPIDLYFEDSVHEDPVFSSNIEFWSSHVRENGVICGHDFYGKFPDVVRGVKSLAKKLERDITLVQSFWCLLPDTEPGSIFKSKLEMLGEGTVMLA